MGRTEKSQGLAPPAIRKDIRAKQARQIINKTIPALLVSNARARKGSEGSELIADPGADTNDPRKSEADVSEDAAYVKRKGQGRRKAKTERGADNEAEFVTGSSKSRGKNGRRQDSVDNDLASLSITDAKSTTPRTERKVRVITTDTLTAAHLLAYPSKYGHHEPKPLKKVPNVCILNMASPLRPGGGVLTGATSQEEYLCARTTLLPSLHESFYRLPEYGGIWSPDVLVFRNRLALGDAKGELAPSDRYWIDVISGGMLRFPELESGDDDGDDEVKKLSKSDRAVVESKMRAVLRIAARKGVRKLVLGAWGCGAYGNPVADIAQAWKKVLDGTGGRKSKAGAGEADAWPHLEDVVFAVSNRKMAADFARAFDAGVEVESGPGDAVHDEDEEDEDDKVAEELRAKIVEMESQLGKVWNPDLKSRMGVILDGLRAQLKEREGTSLGSNAQSSDGEDTVDSHDGELVSAGEESAAESEEYVKV